MDPIFSIYFCQKRFLLKNNLDFNGKGSERVFVGLKNIVFLIIHI